MLLETKISAHLAFLVLSFEPRLLFFCFNCRSRKTNVIGRCMCFSSGEKSLTALIIDNKTTFCPFQAGSLNSLSIIEVHNAQPFRHCLLLGDHNSTSGPVCLFCVSERPSINFSHTHKKKNQKPNPSWLLLCLFLLVASSTFINNMYQVYYPPHDVVLHSSPFTFAFLTQCQNLS